MPMGNCWLNSRDDQFDCGQFGLFIGSPDTDNFTVYVDEVATWDLDE